VDYLTALFGSWVYLKRLSYPWGIIWSKTSLTSSWVGGWIHFWGIGLTGFCLFCFCLLTPLRLQERYEVDETYDVHEATRPRLFTNFLESYKFFCGNFLMFCIRAGSGDTLYTSDIVFSF